jgi:hypothetical protein
MYRICAHEHTQYMEGTQTYEERSNHWNLESTTAEDKSQDTTTDDTLPPPF